MGGAPRVAHHVKEDTSIALIHVRLEAILPVSRNHIQIIHRHHHLQNYQLQSGKTESVLIQESAEQVRPLERDIR